MATQSPPITDPCTWTIRPARGEDAPAALDVLNQVFGHWGSPEDYRWKFFDTPAGFHLPAWIAEVDGRIVAHYGMVALPAVLDGTSIRAGQSVDAGVLPPFRRLGIVSAIESEIMNQAANAGLTLIYAFPGLRSVSMHDRIGYSPFAFIPELTVLIEPRKVLGRALRSLPGDLLILRRAIQKGSHALTPQEIKRMFMTRWFMFLLLAWTSSPVFSTPRKLGTARYSIQPITGFDSRFDRLWDEICPQNGLSLVKNAAYLSWRYGARPSRQNMLFSAERNGLLRAYMVIGQKNDEQWPILDMNAAPGEEGAFSDLLDSARKYFKQVGAEVVNTWSVFGSNTYPVLRKHGFISQHRLHQLASKNRWLHNGLNQIILYSRHLSAEQNTKLIDRAGKWWVAKGDSDLG